MTDTETVFGVVFSGQPNEFSRINHPSVKALLTITPLVIGSAVLLLRLKHIHVRLDLLFLYLIIIIACQKLDFRFDKTIKTQILILFLLSSLVLVILNITQVIDINQTLDFLSLKFPLLKNIESFLTIEDVLVLLFFFVAVRGISLFVATDVLWLCRFLLFKSSQTLFITVIFTFFAVQKTIPNQFNLAWTTARNKMMLLRNKNTLLKAFTISCKLFLQKFLYGLDDTAKLTQSILKERGFYKKVARNEILFARSAEDNAAIIIFIISIIFSIVYYTKR